MKPTGCCDLPYVNGQKAPNLIIRTDKNWWQKRGAAGEAKVSLGVFLDTKSNKTPPNIIKNICSIDFIWNFMYIYIFSQNKCLYLNGLFLPFSVPIVFYSNSNLLNQNCYIPLITSWVIFLFEEFFGGRDRGHTLFQLGKQQIA